MISVIKFFINYAIILFKLWINFFFSQAQLFSILYRQLQPRKMKISAHFLLSMSVIDVIVSKFFCISCFSKLCMYSVFPALKQTNQIILCTVTVFPFNTHWPSEIEKICVSAVLEMDVFVSCYGLTDVEYTVAIGITLIVNVWALLSGSFSQSFTPVDPSLPSSISGSWL